MPIKHQSDSFRTKNGKRFICSSDFGSVEEAIEHVAALRADGFAAFREKGDGYIRVFVDEAKYPKTKAEGRTP